MRLTLAELNAAAAAEGFQPLMLEKVLRLLDLLEGIQAHPYLRGRLALKGGTALNLFMLDLPRLSVDVDLNYIGAVDRETMLAERPKVEQAIQAACGRLDLMVRRVPADHAGGKWRLGYAAAGGGTGTLELDLNFVLRAPLWPVELREALRVAGRPVVAFPVLDLHELVAGKLAALFGRTAARDLYDARALLQLDGLDAERLRLGFVVYGAMNRRDWREIALDDVDLEPREVERTLVPVLRRADAPARVEIPAWTRALVEETQELLGCVLPLREHERDFLERLNGRGEIAPELLTDDAGLQATLLAHPGLLWKAVNVRGMRG